jgi:hypothetical protein
VQTEPSCAPGAAERCNGIDDDCDGVVDEGGFCSPINDTGDFIDVLWSFGSGDTWLLRVDQVSSTDEYTVVRWDGSAFRPVVFGTGDHPNTGYGTADGALWLVGADERVVRWDGTRWEDLDTLVEASLGVVWAAGRNGAWVGGWNGVVLEWNGRIWQDRSPGCAGSVQSMSGTGADDVWVLFDVGLRHWDGTEWHRVSLPAGNLPDRVIALAPDDVWLRVDLDTECRGLLHWNGLDWQPDTTLGCLAPGMASGFLPGSPWRGAGGGLLASDETGQVWSRSDGTWRVVASPPPVAWPLSAGGAGGDDLWVLSLREVFSYGAVEVLHWDGARWSRPGGVSGALLDGVGGVPGGPTWVTGWGVTPDEPYVGGLWEREGNDWVPVQTGPGVVVHDVWASSPTEAWAVGEDLVLGWDGLVWRPVVEVNGWGDFVGVHGSAPDDVWMVGETFVGELLWAHWDGTTWRRTVGAERGLLRDVWVAGPAAAWAVGQGPPSEDEPGPGLILRWDGTSWSRVAVSSRGPVSSVHGFGADDVWATTWFDGVLHWDGAAWTTDARPEGLLNDAWGPSPDRLWVVGDDGVAWMREGGSWVREPSTGADLRAVWGADGSEVLAVTSSGAVLVRRE